MPVGAAPVTPDIRAVPCLSVSTVLVQSSGRSSASNEEAKTDPRAGAYRSDTGDADATDGTPSANATRDAPLPTNNALRFTPRLHRPVRFEDRHEPGFATPTVDARGQAGINP
jgi:hypothetical protein